MVKSNFFHIAIDGPVAAGKGTVSRLVAEELGFLYIDTGAMYRMTALLCIKNNVDMDKEDQVAKLVEKSKMEMKNPSEDEKDGRLTTVFLNGEDVSWKIRTEEVSQGSSRVAVLPTVRKLLVKKQQQIADGKNIIMEGRDITYRVLPNANLKIYLTASDVIRTKRRHMQLLTKGKNVEFEDVHKELLQRDDRDMKRVSDPLKIVNDAWVIDTSDLNIEKVVDMIVARVKMLQS
jgi:CMP/dCMP kinase